MPPAFDVQFVFRNEFGQAPAAFRRAFGNCRRHINARQGICARRNRVAPCEDMADQFFQMRRLCGQCMARCLPTSGAKAVKTRSSGL